MNKPDSFHIILVRKLNYNYYNYCTMMKCCAINTFADDNQPLKKMISPEDTKESNALLQERSGRDGEASQRSHASGNGDVYRNQTEENVFHIYSIEPPRKGDRETDLQDMEHEENGKCSFCIHIHLNTYRAVI